MNGGTRVKITAYVVIGVYSVIFAVYGITLPSGAARVLGFLPVVLVLLFAAFDNWLWRIGPLPGLLKQPVLIGTWHGELISYRRDTNDQPMTSNHEVFVVIRQTLTSISVTLISAESKSRSAAAQVVRLQADDYVVQYQYQNEPKLAFRQAGSSVHTGGSSIEAGGARPKTLTGEYWTARETRGTFGLDFVTTSCVNTFEAGIAALQTGAK